MGIQIYEYVECGSCVVSFGVHFTNAWQENGVGFQCVANCREAECDVQ